MPHGNFKDKDIKPESGRARALKLFALTECETCGTTGHLERHHKDGNPINNDESNIEILCRYHHMIADGRIHKAPRPCINCGQLTKVLRKGRCGACDNYYRNSRAERPERLWTHV